MPGTASIGFAGTGKHGKILAFKFLGQDGSTPTQLVSVNKDTIENVYVSALGGTWRLSTDTETTASMPVGADPSVVQTALRALASLGNNVSVSSIYPYIIQYSGALAGIRQSLLSITTGSLVGSVPAPSTVSGTTAASFIDNNETGHTTGLTSSGFATVSLGEGGQHLQLQSPTGDTRNFAKATFTGLATGTYVLSMNWIGASNQDANATYRVYDGSTYLGKHVVDQTIDSRIETGLLGGEVIGLYYCASGSLSVSLADEHSGRQLHFDSAILSPASWRGGPNYTAVTDLLGAWIARDYTSPPSYPSGPSQVSYIGFPYSESGSFTQRGRGDAWREGDRYSTSLQPSDTATWQFDQIIPGVYKVEINWYQNTDRTTQAVYSVLDGATGSTSILGPVSIDQKNTSPVTTGGGSSHNDYYGQSIPFQFIGNVTVTKNTARIRLSYASGTVTPDGALSSGVVAMTLLSTTPYTEAIIATSSYSTEGGSITLKKNGTPTSLASTCVFDTSVSHITEWGAFRITGAAIASGDTVTADIPIGYFVTRDGPIPGYTGLAVQNKFGGTGFTPAVGGQERTMRTGLNFRTPEQIMMVYENLIKASNEFNQSQLAGTSFSGYNAQGYPSFSAGGGEVSCVVTIPVYNPVDSKFTPNLPADATYTFSFESDGSAQVYLEGDNPSVVTWQSGSADKTPASGHISKVYRITAPTNQYGPTIYLTIKPTAAGTPITNAKLYGSWVNLSSPALFASTFMQVLSKTQTIRNCVAIRAVDTGIGEISEHGYAGDSNGDNGDMSYNSQARSVYHNIISVQDYPDTEGAFQPAKIPILLTFSAPHDFTPSASSAKGAGKLITLYPAAGSSATGVDIPLNDGINTLTIGLQGQGNYTYYNPATMTSSQLAYTQDSPIGTPIRLQSGVHSVNIRGTHAVGSVPIIDSLKLVAAIPGCACWFTIPCPASDAYITAVANLIVQYIPADRLIFIENGNEPWNSFLLDYFYYWIVGSQWASTFPSVPGDNNLGNAVRAKAAWDIMAPIFETAGRTAKFKRVAGSQESYSGQTNAVVAAFKAVGATPDVFAIAPYLYVLPNQPPGIEDECELWGADDIAEIFALEMATGKHNKNYADQLAIITATGNFPNAKMVSYEGGPATLYLGGTSNLTKAAQSQAVVRHPDMYDIMRTHLYGIQQAGQTMVHNDYGIPHIFGDEGGIPYSTVYSPTYGWNQRAGRNDGTDPAFTDPNGTVIPPYDVRPDLAGSSPPGHANMLLSRSPVLAALDSWLNADFNVSVTSGVTLTTTATVSTSGHQPVNFPVTCQAGARFSNSARTNSLILRATAVFSSGAESVIPIGRFRIGDPITIAIDSSSFTPDGIPTATFYGQGGSAITVMPVTPKNQHTSFAVTVIPSPPDFTVGTFFVDVAFTVAGAPYSTRFSFQVVPGGDAYGSVIGLFSVDQPSGTSVIAQLSTSRLVQGNSPRI